MAQSQLRMTGVGTLAMHNLVGDVLQKLTSSVHYEKAQSTPSSPASSDQPHCNDQDANDPKTHGLDFLLNTHGFKN